MERWECCWLLEARKSHLELRLFDYIEDCKARTFSKTAVITSLLTSWSRVLLEKPTGSQLVKKFSAFFWNPKVHFRIYKCPPAVRILSQLDPSMHPHPNSWRSIFNIILHLRLDLPCSLFPSGFPTKTLYMPLLSFIRATFPARLILLVLITRTILGEEYRPLSSLLCTVKPA